MLFSREQNPRGFFFLPALPACVFHSLLLQSILQSRVRIIHHTYSICCISLHQNKLSRSPHTQNRWRLFFQSSQPAREYALTLVAQWTDAGYSTGHIFPGNCWHTSARLPSALIFLSALSAEYGLRLCLPLHQPDVLHQ